MDKKALDEIEKSIERISEAANIFIKGVNDSLVKNHHGCNDHTHACVDLVKLKSVIAHAQKTFDEV